MPVVAFHSSLDSPADWEPALRRHLPDLDWRTDERPGDPAEVQAVLAWKPPPGYFARFPGLRLVVNLGAGADALLGRDDLPAVPISRLNDPGMVRLMTSYVVFAVTRHARDIPAFEAAQRRREWRYIHPRPLDACRVGVLGLGELGAAAALALAAMGYTVRGWSRSPKSLPGIGCLHGEAGLRALLAATDVLVVMLPLTGATRGLLDAGMLALLPRGAALVNVGRGPVVAEAALVEALRSGRLGGATLDVFDREPLPPEHPLWAMENVLITPHIASITVPGEAAPDVAESIRRVLAGRPPLHEVQAGRGY
ncbi:glyoxylate/hydroxypyruvate reductase A [Roseomonas sp. NAR14]|uniref:Glyoxylate/hydroxypyruvate reductase A n=1 Tax=Roseomonas acroporae TaxID=2937791 RepID=A0A9X1YD58_9PROT|nr:glyoxylate/hydroxypyruvate reductase A [Roseomonas acroporae]MCK8784381.1 glyoxylate/hydroxypyruvate reductase A [Roseomonas acroporae]